MTWVTWRQFRYQGALAAALLAALAVLLLISGMHAAQVWHSALAGCRKDNSCGNLGLSNGAFTTLVAATAAVPLLAGLFWGAPMVAHELETGTNQFAWTQSITRRRWLAVRAGWLLLAAAVLAGAVSALVTWWMGPDHALTADAFKANRFNITGIAPVGYAIFAMALGICAGALLRRTLPALAVTLGRLRRHPGADRAVAPAALHDPGHRVLQAHGLAFAEGVLPDCQPGHRRPQRAAPGRHRQQLRVERRADPGRMPSRPSSTPHLLHPAWRRTATGGT